MIIGCICAAHGEVISVACPIVDCSGASDESGSANRDSRSRVTFTN
jgi:hypothetical protein